MNWGTSIFISFTIFMAIIITMVVISMRQDISLVATDYYKQELDYQQQIDQQQNALGVSDEVSFDYHMQQHQLIIKSIKPIRGEVHFYRPSDALRDVKVPFDIQNGVKTISTSKMDNGLWKIKLTWSQEGKLHYVEKTVVI